MEIDLLTKKDLSILETKLDKVLTIISNESDIQTSDWIRTSKVKHILNISDSTLKRYRDTGVIPYTLIGSTFFYSKTAIADILSKHQGELLTPNINAHGK
jgi:hypothetical protein